jgi:vitamin B12 transporter
MQHSMRQAAHAGSSALAIAISASFGALPGSAIAQASADRPEEIIVTSSLLPQPRRQIATAVSVIDFEEIELRGYTDLTDVLRTQPGIGVSNSGGSGKSTALRIRGEESYRTLLMIDGVKALDPSAPQVAPSFDSLLTTSDLQRVEVLRGPQGFMYGADAGGVVNILTKRGSDDFGGLVGLEVGEYSLQKLDAAVSGAGDNGDYFVSVADLKTDGFNAQSADTVLRDADGAENRTLHAKVGWNVADTVRVQLVARDIDAETAYDGCFSSITFATVHDCRGTTEQTTYKWSVEHSSGDVTNSFGYSDIDIDRDNFSQGLPAFNTQGDLGRFEYTGSYKPVDGLTLVYGIDLQDEGLVDGDGRDERGQKGYYVEYQGAFNDRFFISLGGRYDDNDDFGTHTSTRATVAYVQDLGSQSSLKYRASVGTGFRAPSLFEIAYNAGPFAFPPAAGLVLHEETSDGYDVGIELDTASGLHFEVTYFDQDIENAIFFDLDTFAGYLQSLGTSNSEGVEIAADIPFGEQWALLLNWTNNDTTDLVNPQRLRRPENVGNVGVRYRSPNEKVGFIANYRLADDMLDTNPVFGAPPVTVDGYEVLDFSATFDVNDTLQIFGRVQNAADETYQEVRGFNSAERSLYAGARLRF